jgi:4-hydroxy-tetrahydrodipicolinate synthase
MQIEGWIDGVLILWTTAENPTLSKEEWLEIVKFVINILKWKIKIMVNVWTYSTKSSIDNIKDFDKIEWIDAYLVVNPYYNKPTQTGLKKHFISCAESTLRDIILYNIEWRTSINLETSTLLDIIWECGNVVWVKEASWNMEQMKEVVEKTPDDFLVFSWDDALTYELIQNWWNWVISVASNIYPKMIKWFVDSCFNDKEEASDLNNIYSELFSKLFIQANPLPAKTYLASNWIIKEEFRLPMCRMDEKERDIFLDFIEKFED